MDYDDFPCILTDFIKLHQASMDNNGFQWTSVQSNDCIHISADIRVSHLIWMGFTACIGFTWVQNMFIEFNEFQQLSMHSNQFNWIAVDWSWLPLYSNGVQWIPVKLVQFPSIPIDFIGFQCTKMICNEFHWISIHLNEF